MAERIDPFTLVFGILAEERFPGPGRLAGRATGRVETDRDAFILDRAVVELLRDLVPEPHEADGISEFVATLHHAYLYWRAGGRWCRSTGPRRGTPLPGRDRHPASDHPTDRPSTYYRFPERLVWAPLTPEAPHEPLDGLFVRATAPATITCSASSGCTPRRPGFGVAGARVPGPRR